MDYREHSFLRNPRMPADVRRSRVHVRICQPVGASPNQLPFGLWTCTPQENTRFHFLLH
jgi:hypothetical protein